MAIPLSRLLEIQFTLRITLIVLLFLDKAVIKQRCICWETPQHGHPGVDARIIYLNGTLSGSCNGEKLLDSTPVCDHEAADGTNPYMGAEHPFDGTDIHTVWAGHKGALVIITQHWAEGLDMSSQSVHYTGEPLGPIHAPNIKVAECQSA